MLYENRNKTDKTNPGGPLLRVQETEGQEASYHDKFTIHRKHGTHLLAGTGRQFGLVINDEGKDDLVICSSSWLDPFHTEDFGSVVNCALRYAMHAKDAESEAVIRYLRRRCGILDEKTLSVAVADLDKELKQSLPSLKNPPIWPELQAQFRQWLTELRTVLSENTEQLDALAKHDKA